MSQSSVQSDVLAMKSAGAALLVTTDTLLFLDIQAIFQGFGVALSRVNCARETAAMIHSVGDVDYVLLDARMPAVNDGSLLEAMSEWSQYRRGAVAVIATGPNEEWIGRLRHGVIDDIIPVAADASTWRTRLGVMQRNRKMQAELEDLRVTAQMELERDPVTGAFSREMVLKLLFRETDRVQRLRGELSLMLFSLEGFERWIEELTHQVCDGLLREVVARAGRALRSYDLLGRVEQHAFLIALPGCTPACARALADRLRIEMFGEPFLVRSERGDFVGVELKAAFAIAPSLGRSPLVVLREAEVLLEKAKRDGSGHPLAEQGSCGEKLGLAKSAKGLHLLSAERLAGRNGFHGLV